MEITNTWWRPFNALGVDPHLWCDAFDPDRIDDWDDEASGWFDVRENGESIGGLDVIYVSGLGWSLEQRRGSALTGSRWIRVADPTTLDRWVQDDSLLMMPEGSFLNGPTAAREVVRFLQAPLDPPEGSAWIDSTTLDWPEEI